jgi:hypothetical protein
MFFDWGARPPRNMVVYLGNTTTPDGESLYGNEIIITLNSIEPSLPYDAVAAAASSQMVEPVQGNTTTVDVEGGCWSGGYVRLVVEGCWEEDGLGATVGEFVLLGGA